MRPGPRTARRRAAFFRAVLALVALALAASGCARPPRPGVQPCPPAGQAAAAPPPAEAELRDIRELPQSLAALLAAQPSAPDTDTALLSAQAQEAFALRLREAHFAPWRQQAASYPRAAALWGLEKLASGRHFGENLRPLGPEFRAEMEAQCQAWAYPSLARPAIATANAALRVLPTSRPGFLKPTRPGEGFPFDYWQNSGVWAGTPLLVTHLSADGAWALVEARNCGGWLRVADLAFVDEPFMAAWSALPLLAVTRERAPVAGRVAGRETFLFHGRIGTLLPLAENGPDGCTALAPARGADGLAVSVAVRLPVDAAAPMPLALTPRRLAALADQMLGQPYGWGGYLDNRDCSALLVDLFAPFGVFLPRNSGQQARAGEYLSLKGLTAQEKQALVLERGIPLLTLLHKPGHIMLYLGRGAGQAAGKGTMLHAVWGLKTLDESGVEGRAVIGRTVVTSLEPGAELPDVVRAGTLLEGLTGMTLVAPGGNPPPGPDRTR